MKQKLEPILSEDRLKSGLPEKLKKLIEKVPKNAKSTLEYDKKDRPYDLSSPGPYPDY